MATDTIRLGLDEVQAAVDTRALITECYRTYAVLSKIVQATALVDHSDFKNAVDALYYFGGGWPTENSKGRMERALDNFAGMYKVLTLIGRGSLVEKHLEAKGITVMLKKPIADSRLSSADIRLLDEDFDMKQFDFKNITCLSSLVAHCVGVAQELQGSICANADKIKHGFKPTAKMVLGIEDEEYDRIVFMTKFKSSPDRVVKKKNKIEGSVAAFREVARKNI